MVKHLTDDEVQQFVIDKQHCDINILDHIHVCMECKIKAGVYRSLITGIKQQAQPVFDFDLSASVLNQLPMQVPKTASERSIIWALILVSVGFLAGGAYYFRSYVASMFEGMTTIFIYLIAISVVTVIAALVFDMYRKYKKEMKVLDLY
jgi:hypothetical protein